MKRLYFFITLILLLTSCCKYNPPTICRYAVRFGDSMRSRSSSSANSGNINLNSSNNTFLYNKISRKKQINEIKLIDQNKSGKLTAGEICDFTKYNLWNQYVEKDYITAKNTVGIILEERYTVQVNNAEGYGLPFAKVALRSNNNEIWHAYTDNTGKAELWLLSKTFHHNNLSISIEYGGYTHKIDDPLSFSEGINRVSLPIQCEPKNTPVEICFVVDATSSMADEIDYLKSDISKIIEDIKTTVQKEVSFSSVFYKALEDKPKGMLATFRSSTNISKLDEFIDDQKADGGGVEAVAEGLHEAIYNTGWNAQPTHKIMFILLDEPPGFTEADKTALKTDLEEAARRGIRIVPVFCSGYDKELEYLMRCSALMTNGTYFFLTDDSGIGNKHMEPTIDEYKVYTLQELMVNVIQRFTAEANCRTEVLNAMDKERIDYLSRKDIEPVQPKLSEADNQPDSSQQKLTEKSIDIKTYPNPCTSDCLIEFTEPVEGKVYLMDANGKLIWTGNFTTGTSIKLDMNPWSLGTYYVVIETQEKKWVEKVVKYQ